MHIKIIVTLAPDETARDAQALARLKNLEVAALSGDADGRGWVQFAGHTDEDGLQDIIRTIHSPLN